MLQNNFSECFECSLKETKHFHWELAPSGVFRTSITETSCLKQGDTKWGNFCCALLPFYTKLVSKGAVVSIIREQHKASGEGAILVLPRLGLHLLNLCSVGNLPDCDGDKPLWDWLPVYSCLLVSETHLIMDCLLLLSLWLLFYLKYFVSSSWNW